MADEPLHHIQRAMLPWQRHQLTECGLDPASYPTWTRDEAVAQHRKLGEQRFSLFACMNCMHTASRHQTWDQNPASCMARHVQVWGMRDDQAAQIQAELRAMAALIAAHRDEFDETVAGLLNLTTLDDHRKARAVQRYGQKGGR